VLLLPGGGGVSFTSIFTMTREQKAVHVMPVEFNLSFPLFESPSFNELGTVSPAFSPFHSRTVSSQHARESGHCAGATVQYRTVNLYTTVSRKHRRAVSNGVGIHGLGGEEDFLFMQNGSLPRKLLESSAFAAVAAAAAAACVISIRHG
jgi:hypothetical protein